MQQYKILLHKILIRYDVIQNYIQGDTKKSTQYFENKNLLQKLEQ